MIKEPYILLRCVALVLGNNTLNKLASLLDLDLDLEPSGVMLPKVVVVLLIHFLVLRRRRAIMHAICLGLAVTPVIVHGYFRDVSPCVLPRIFGCLVIIRNSEVTRPGSCRSVNAMPAGSPMVGSVPYYTLQ